MASLTEICQKACCVAAKCVRLRVAPCSPWRQCPVACQSAEDCALPAPTLLLITGQRLYSIQPPLKSGFQLVRPREGCTRRLEGGWMGEARVFFYLGTPGSLPRGACLLCASVATRELPPSAAWAPTLRRQHLPLLLIAPVCSFSCPNTVRRGPHFNFLWAVLFALTGPD